MKVILVALVATITSLLAAPAQAAAGNCTGDLNAYTGPAVESLCWPTDRVVVIEGPARLWKLRLFAEHLEARLPGLDVRSAACADFPEGFCVTVVKEKRGAKYAGTVEWDWPTGAVLRLNRMTTENTAAARRATAAHEFLHILGLRHHGESGLMGPTLPYSLNPEPSADEWLALEQHYS